MTVFVILINQKGILKYSESIIPASITSFTLPFNLVRCALLKVTKSPTLGFLSAHKLQNKHKILLNKCYITQQ